MIGQKIKQAISKSDISAEQVAAHAEMSMTNLYKIYKRDSIESRYLKKIAEILGLPYGYFLDDDPMEFSNSGQANYAHQVGKNKQSITIGEEDCLKQLASLKEKYELLQKTVADKDMIIELLKGQKQG